MKEIYLSKQWQINRIKNKNPGRNQLQDDAGVFVYLHYKVYRIHILIMITIIDLMRKIGYNTDIQKRENLDEMKCWKI